MGTFHLGLSMAGTVSAGTYTGGTLVEIINWLSAWQKARTAGVTLKAIVDTVNFKVGDEIRLEPSAIPNHFVKIKSLSGASGGGVSAMLLLAGLALGKPEEFLRDIWTRIDIDGMLNTGDLSDGEKIFSLLNVKPIDDMVAELMSKKFGEEDFAKELDYLDDHIEIFLTLASYEGIPFSVSPAEGNKVSYGVHRTHLDYIKFNFSKNGVPAPEKPNLPYAHNLVFKKNSSLGDLNSWKQFINSCPATAAFPGGFSPRVLSRTRNEYTGKLFYLNYANTSDNFDYAGLKPAWTATASEHEPFKMEYADGGTFNRDPHDLARASIIESLNLPEKRINPDGENTKACVILIDPFPSNFDLQEDPGIAVEGIPPLLFQQVGLLVGALMNQGRFRPDWVEKVINDKYYSRYLISPMRRDKDNNEITPTMAASLLGAFSGFIDKGYREHDYGLGHYNTYKFLSDYFTLPIKNVEVNYCQNISVELKEKYEALGWFKLGTAIGDEGHCQIIPRMMEPSAINSLEIPKWNAINEDQWNEICKKVETRGKKLADVLTDFRFNRLGDGIIWKAFLKKRIEKLLEKVEEKLRTSELLK